MALGILETYQGSMNGFMSPEAKIRVLEQQLT
jgi:hypothetical protein